MISNTSSNAIGGPLVEVASFTHPFDSEVLTRLSLLLPEYVAARRWYRTKTRTIQNVHVEDALRITGSACLLVLKIAFEVGSPDHYILPVVFAAKENVGKEVIAHLKTASGETGTLYSGLEDDAFLQALLGMIACEKNADGMQGTLVAARTSALEMSCEEAASHPPASSVSRAEQSNTSIIYGDRFILKLFRKLEQGVNPDLEIGRFLTEHRFHNTPAVLGSLEYHANGQSGTYAAAILQRFVPNEGDAWKYTLDSLAGFFDRALSSKRNAPVRSSEHPLDLIGQEIPSELRTAIGSYLESVALLGKRTAEMHAALTDSGADPDFAPEPFTAEDGERLHRELIGQADIAFGDLRRRHATLSGPAAADADEILRRESEIGQRFAAIKDHSLSTPRLRHHGDYHLGQVLYTGQDFMIIDFEGEPARPLEDRRAKALALRDVAGMLRSFHYAAYAALFGQIPGLPSDPDSIQKIEGWAAAWNAAVAPTYLKSYFETARNASFVPASWAERRIQLDALLLQKALYEVAYELNNRPDWLPIPLKGILSLVR